MKSSITKAKGAQCWSSKCSKVWATLTLIQWQTPLIMNNLIIQTHNKKFERFQPVKTKPLTVFPDATHTHVYIRLKLSGNDGGNCAWLSESFFLLSKRCQSNLNNNSWLSHTIRVQRHFSFSNSLLEELVWTATVTYDWLVWGNLHNDWRHMGNDG